MNVTALLRFFFLIIFLGPSGNAQRSVSGPRITTAISGDELVVQSLSNIVLECQSTKPIEWTLPALSHHLSGSSVAHNISNRAGITLSQVENAIDSYKYHSRLEVNEAHYLDTGYFVCHHVNATDFDNTLVATKVYVYVEDDENLIAVPDKDDLITVFAHQSRREVIPCRPTSPSVKMSLVNDEEGEVSSSDGDHLGNWNYDPREGFITQDAQSSMIGHYTCTAQLGEGKLQDLSVSLNVLPATASAPKPHIDVSLATFVVVNQNFKLNCSAYFEPATTVELTWSVPGGIINGQRISTGILTAHDSNVGDIVNKVAHLVLNVNNVTKEDEGNYTCKATDHTGKSETTTTYVKVHEDGVSYVSISDEGLKFEIDAIANDSVKWIVNFEAHPLPEVIWFKSGDPDFVIKQTALKYELKKEAKRTTLEILNLNGGDSGYYKIVVKTFKAQDVRKFILKVKDKPSVKAYSRRAFVKTDQDFEVTCQINSYPQADVEVLFRPCIPQIESLGSEHNTTFKQRECKEEWSLLYSNNKSANAKEKMKQNEEKFSLIPRDYRSQVINVTGRARIGGEYLCNACNSFGCSETGSRPSIKIGINDLAVDVSDIELVRSQLRAPVLGESFNLSCAISLYNFIPKFTWTWTLPNGSMQAIDQRSPLQGSRFLKVETNYSYTEFLIWDLMSQSADGNYSCHAINSFNRTVSTVARIIVQPGQPPNITNKSDEIVTIPKFTELTLFCDAIGLPPPSVEWFKDGVPIQDGLSYDQKTLSISHAKTADSGFYSCRFKNIKGIEEALFSVSVLEPPLGSGIIAGIVIVSIIVLVLLALLIHKILQDKKRKAFFAAHQLDMFDKGNPESINPELPVDEQAELLPYDKKWEFPRDCLKLGKQLGAGAFGRVLKADAIGIVPSEPITTVAVKMVRSQGNMIGLKALMSELKIMVHMGSHLNVVNLLGACTKNVTKGELLVIVEYCRYGNIQNYLIKHRSKFINEIDQQGRLVERHFSTTTPLTADTPRSPSRFQFDSADYNGAQAVATEVTLLTDGRSGDVTYQMDGPFDSAGKQSLVSSPSGASEIDSNQIPWRSNYRGDYRDEPETVVRTRDLICWAFQIARGMEYLARRKILHGDLAARNVLLAEHNIVKIADFGLAREVYRSGNYKKKGEGPLPVKWMAIESITDRVFSTQSDVWSFGIVLWELFSIGKTPYPGMEADEYFFVKVKQGYRMDKPKLAPSAIGEIMRECWLYDPMSRPSFSELADRLGLLLEASVRRHYVELNEGYNSTNDAPTEDYLGMMAPVDYVNVGSRTPVPEHRDYVNVPQNDESRDSDYLPMERQSPKLISEEKPPGDYFLMSSTQTSPRLVNDNQFDFNFAQKRKADESSSVIEMHPILHQSPEPTSNSHNTSPVNGFSNPNYQNPPIIVSDLDDPPSSEHYTMPRVLSLNNAKNYVNVTDHSTDNNVEPYYAQPKSGAKAV